MKAYVPFGVIAMPRGSRPTGTGAPTTCGVALVEIDDAHRAVDGVGHVGALVVWTERDEARLLADRHLGEQLARVGAVLIAHANHGHRALLPIDHHGARVVARQRDAARASLAEQGR